MILFAVVLAASVATQPLPAEVRAFLRRHRHCDALAYMDYPDVTTAHRVEEAMRRDCTGIDAEKRRLLRRYHNNRALRSILAQRENIDS